MRLKAKGILISFIILVLIALGIFNLENLAKLFERVEPLTPVLTDDELSFYEGGVLNGTKNIDHVSDIIRYYWVNKNHEMMIFWETYAAENGSKGSMYELSRIFEDEKRLANPRLSEFYRKRYEKATNPWGHYPNNGINDEWGQPLIDKKGK